MADLADLVRKEERANTHNGAGARRGDVELSAEALKEISSR